MCGTTKQEPKKKLEEGSFYLLLYKKITQISRSLYISFYSIIWGYGNIYVKTGISQIITRSACFSPFLYLFYFFPLFPPKQLHGQILTETIEVHISFPKISKIPLFFRHFLLPNAEEKFTKILKIILVSRLKKDLKRLWSVLILILWDLFPLPISKVWRGPCVLSP